jgi:hypothetical protein
VADAASVGADVHGVGGDDSSTRIILPRAMFGYDCRMQSCQTKALIKLAKSFERE